GAATRGSVALHNVSSRTSESLLVPLSFFFSSRRRHTRCYRDWSSDVCSSDLFTSSTTSSGETRTTSYHAPRRTLQFTSPRTRAHCGASGIVAPQELVALTHTRRWPGGAPSTAAALQARDTASRKGLPIGR